MRVPWRKVVAGAVATLGTAIAVAFAVPLPERLDEPGSPVVLYADGTPASVFLSGDDKWRIDASLDRVDPHYVDALLAFEDARFWWHPGVDPIALLRAAGQDLRSGTVISGGSTITMQVIREIGRAHV